MRPDEVGIIGNPSTDDPERPALWRFLLEEGAWLLAALAVTVLAASFLQGRGGHLADAAPAVALFGLHGLVGVHVIRTELSKLAVWFRIDRRAIVWGVVGGALLLGFNALYGFVLERAGVVPPDIAAWLRSLLPQSTLILWAAVLAPVVEEMYFRGRILDALTVKVGPGWAGLISSFTFAAIHGIREFFLAYLVFAYVLLALRRRTGGLAAPIIAHMINNAIALIG